MTRLAAAVLVLAAARACLPLSVAWFGWWTLAGWPLLSLVAWLAVRALVPGPGRLSAGRGRYGGGRPAWGRPYGALAGVRAPGVAHGAAARSGDQR